MLNINKFFLSAFLLIISFNLIESSLKFNIPTNRDKCFHQEIYFEGTILIRYDLTGFEKDFIGNDREELFRNIKIFVKDDKEKIIYQTILKGRKDKFAILIKESGSYFICARYYKPWRGKDLSPSVMMGLKIRNDYHYTEIKQSLHKEDVNNFWRKIREIKSDMRPSIEASKIELNAEDETAKSIIASVDTYYKLCCVQLAIIIVITIYTIVSYKDFFKEKSLI